MDGKNVIIKKLDNMKKAVILIYGCLSGLFFGCTEKIVDWQPSTDSIAPGIVTNVQIENLPGAAKITYSLPDDEDLVAVEAVYTINGKLQRTSASVYTNSLTVYGFGSTDAQTIQLYCVDRSRNYSQATEAQINPLTPPVISIFESIKMSATFGGVSLQWDNPTKADVSVWILAEDSTGSIKETETVYTSTVTGQFKLRGFDAVEKIFGVYVRDRWNNLSDTLYSSLTPFFEEKIDSRPFKSLRLPRDEDASALASLFDGNIAVGMFTSNEVSLAPVFFTIDLGQTVVFSRYKLWHRNNVQYINASPKLWKIYGALDPNLTITDTDYWVTGYQEDWILLSNVDDISMYKPSGDEVNITDEDRAAATSGFDLECIGDAIPVRYIRFEITENWAVPIRTVIGELEFYGALVE